MLLSKARWHIQEADSVMVQQLSESLKLHPILVKVLLNRSMSSREAIEQFLYANESNLHDPFLLDGMSLAVHRIQHAIAHQEKIRIYGDYDADGVCSTVLMMHVLRTLGANFDYYIPHRTREGYGLNAQAIQLAKQSGVGLIITVDNGTSAYAEVELARELGIEVIITDHHEPPDTLPSALCILNPKKANCPYPFKQLAGVGVAFKLAHGLLGYAPTALCEFVTIGTVADLMPLHGENRILVKSGLTQMQTTANLGIQALMEISQMAPAKISAGLIGYALAPRINASGRLEHADEAVRLFMSTSREEAIHIANSLDELNKERQQLVEIITKEAIEQADRLMSDSTRRVLVVVSDHWNVGVVGIVASKLVERYYRPTFVLTKDPLTGHLKGSARSIPRFDLYQALTQCQSWLIQYGGHHAAAGLTIASKDLSGFTATLEQWAQHTLTIDDLHPILYADFSCRLDDITLSLAEQINRLGPFGMGHPTPKVILQDVNIGAMQAMGKEKQHLKITCTQKGLDRKQSIDAIGFNKSHLLSDISPSASLNLLAEVSINEWQGSKQTQVVIQDLSISHIQAFDWRKVPKPDEHIRQLIDRHHNRARYAQHQHVVALICVSDQLIASPPSEHVQLTCPIWLSTEDGHLQPYNSLAASLSITAMSDIVIYHIPASSSVLRTWLATFPYLKRIYCVCSSSTEQKARMSTMPSRETFKQFYLWLIKQAEQHQNAIHDLSAYSRENQISPIMIQFMLTVFDELQFIEYTPLHCKVLPSRQKKELDSSHLYQKQLESHELWRVMVHATSEELCKWVIDYLPNHERQKEEKA